VTQDKSGGFDDHVVVHVAFDLAAPSNSADLAGTRGAGRVDDRQVVLLNQIDLQPENPEGNRALDFW
jgi:hypothetical protein